MSDSIGHLKSRVQLVNRHFTEDHDGNFTEHHKDGSECWAHITPLEMMNKKIERASSMDEWNALEKSFPKRWYFITIRNYRNTMALQASLFGIRLKSRLIKLASPFAPSADGKWLKATGFEC
ncbi:MAG: hypothetical protein Q8K36_01360 [Alphaproteobacteria bacterium]|nr:hypothetical protein [Alphaproteobacteria bacterium]